MPSEIYRYYRLNGAGHLDFAEWFEEASDEDATVQIATKYPYEMSDIWLGTRLVSRLTPSHFNADDPDLQNAVGERLLATARRLGTDWNPRPDRRPPASASPTKPWNDAG